MKDARTVNVEYLCDRLCKDCDSCEGVSRYQLRELFYKADKLLSEYAEGVLFYENWGWGQCTVEEREVFDEIKSDLPVLKRHDTALRKRYTPCLCPSEIRRVYERVLSHVAIIDCDTDYLFGRDLDKEKLGEIEIDTNGCTPYEPWERAMYIKMPSLKVDVSAKECLKFVYDLKVSGKLVEPTFLYKLSVEIPKACNLEYKVDVSRKSCRIEYNSIVERHECEIDLNTYVKLRECGLSYEVIAEAASCDVTPYYDEQNDTIVFKTGNGNEYNLGDLQSLHKIKKL